MAVWYCWREFSKKHKLFLNEELFINSTLKVSRQLLCSIKIFDFYPFNGVLYIKGDVLLSLFCKNSKDTTFLKFRHFVTKNISGVVTYGIRPTFQDSFSQPYDLFPFFWNLIHKRKFFSNCLTLFLRVGSLSFHIKRCR